MAAESLKEDDGATLVYAIGSFRFRRFGRETPLAQSTANGNIQVAYQPFGLNSRRPLQRSPFVFLGQQKSPGPFRAWAPEFWTGVPVTCQSVTAIAVPADLSGRILRNLLIL